MSDKSAPVDKAAPASAGPGNEFVSWADEAVPEVPRAWSKQQAQAWKSNNPSLSPWRIVAAQAVAGMVCAGLTGLVTQHASVAWSALYGAAAVVVPSALLARGMTRGTSHPVAVAAGFMFWEMLKIGVAIAMLAIAVKVVPNLSWPALLVTMVVCIKINWIALLWRGRRSNNKVKQQDGS